LVVKKLKLLSHGEIAEKFFSLEIYYKNGSQATTLNIFLKTCFCIQYLYTFAAPKVLDIENLNLGVPLKTERYNQ